MLALLRQAREMDAMVREGRFDERWKIRLGDLTGAKVGLVGFGRIARCVATICGKGFGCDVAAFDPWVSEDDMRAAGVEPVGLPEIMQRDVISIHTPLTPETRDLIGTPELAMMKPHGIIVNCSRGGIINEKDLARALNDNLIGAAGIDVMEHEPINPDNPLLKLFDKDKILITPHMAWASRESRDLLVEKLARNIEVYQKSVSG